MNKIKGYFAGLCLSNGIFMQKQTRTIRIFISLVASMSIGALALMALDSHSFSAGPFSLASYTSLSSPEQAAGDIAVPDAHSFQQIHIEYCTASVGNIEQLAAANDLPKPEDLDFHFVVFNGFDGIDGEIVATEKWFTQRPVASISGNGECAQAIEIRVISNAIETKPTDCQVKRTADLVESLARKCNIPMNNIHYPKNWQL
jgi:hypothetical protein